MTTNPPYNDEDLRAEAATQHELATTTPDLATVAERMRETEPWNHLGENNFTTAHRHIAGLLDQAANVSYWAIQLGDAALKPHPAMAWHSTNGYHLAVQVATNPQLAHTTRQELLRQIHAAIEDTIRDVLDTHDV